MKKKKNICDEHINKNTPVNFVNINEILEKKQEKAINKGKLIEAINRKRHMMYLETTYNKKIYNVQNNVKRLNKFYSTNNVANNNECSNSNLGLHKSLSYSPKNEDNQKIEYNRKNKIIYINKNSMKNTNQQANSKRNNQNYYYQVNYFFIKK